MYHKRLACSFPLAARVPAVLLAAVLAACETTTIYDPFPEPLRKPKELRKQSDALPKNRVGDLVEPGTGYSQAPPLPIPGISVAAGQIDSLGSSLTGEPIQTSFSGAPLVAFINEVLGNQLGLSFVISPEVQASSALVTLRLTEPLPPSDYFSVVRSVLSQYGVGLIEREGVINVILSEESGSDDVPLLISGRASSDVPVSHRTVFQLVPLRVTSPRNVTGWFSQIFRSRELLILDDGPRNSVVLKGKPEQIAQAVEMIDVLDQPVFRARSSLIVEPEFLDPRQLTRSLEQVLRAEGYEVSSQPGTGVATLLALEEVGRVVIFTGDEVLLDHIRGWVDVLDAQQRDAIEQGVFTYQVVNVQAPELLDSLNGILSAVRANRSNSSSQQGRSRQSGRVFAEKKRNILMFSGSGRDWGEILSLVKILDKPVPSVLIEVLIAEISLDEEVSSGLQFLVDETANSGRYNLGAGTTGFGVASSGLSIVLDRGGAERVRFNLFQRDNRVSIRSSPRLLVRSGASASIEVGNEIPVITQRETSGAQTGGNSNLVESRSYRKTGVQLEISPQVQANGLVDLEISQSLSEARPNSATSQAGSPTILNRSLSTELSLRDGGSLLMGGIISNNRSKSISAVPGLSKLPVVGRLFRSESIQGDRTELVIMVTPYVISTYEEGWDLTESIRKQLTLLSDEDEVTTAAEKPAR